MLLFPNKPKYFVKFTNKKLLTFNTKKTSILRYSQIGLLAKCSGFISNFQIEAVRLYLRRLAKKRSQLFFRVFPDQPITKKPNQVRMGRGVGGLKYWAFYVKPGSTIVEINTNNTQSAVIALNSVKFKLGIKTHIKSMENRWML